MQKSLLFLTLLYLFCSILVGNSYSEEVPVPGNSTELSTSATGEGPASEAQSEQGSANEATVETTTETTTEVAAETTAEATAETSPQSTNPFAERTLVLLKPEVTHRGLIGVILSQIELKGFKIAAMKFLVATAQQIEAHYSDHAGKPFFESLVSRTTNQPIVAIVLEGLNVISEFRRFMGSTDPKKSEMGTLRAQFGMQTERNLIHASDSVENANLEIFLWFSPDEIYSYQRAIDQFVYFE